MSNASPPYLPSAQRLLGFLCLTALAVACADDGSPIRLEITELDPTYAVAGSAGFDLTVTGTGFDDETEVLWNGTAQPVLLATATQIVSHVSADDIREPMSARIWVSQAGGVAFENDFRSLSEIFPVVPQTMTVAPDMSAISVGETAQFSATGILANGDSANVSPLVDWSSSKPQVASVDDDGVVTALAPGTATITATFADFPSLNRSTTLTVVAP